MYKSNTLAEKKGGAIINDLDSLKIYDEFLTSCKIDRIQKIIAKYELFKLVIDKPGDIVECGVHRGSGVYLFAKLQKVFRPNNLSKIIGFDFFGKTSNEHMKFKDDQECVDEHSKSEDFRSEILNNLSKLDIENIELIPGDVKYTTQKYKEKNLGFRISLLVLDVDNYEGTLNCLINLYDNVIKGGIIVLDEYSLRSYGESDAVDEFIKNKNIELKSLPWANTPSAYFVKK